MNSNAMPPTGQAPDSSSRLEAEARMILLVEDEPVTRASMAARLTRLGYRVLEAENGRVGLDMARRERPDLLIVDWMMPEMDGPTFCEAVRRDPLLKSSQLLLMTAHDKPAQIAEGLVRGADDFLSKSASKQEIIARVLAGLRASRLVRELETTGDELKSSMILLQKKQAETEADLQTAATFVHSLLPPQGNPVHGIELAWEYQPSLKLGGDLFDVMAIDAHHLGLYILDASGHGVAAALRSASLMTFLRVENMLQLLGSYDPEKVLLEANRRFPLSADGEYFTLWVGQLHLPTRSLTYATAGHSGALLSSAESPSRWLTRSSFPLGFDPSAQFASDRLCLKSADRLFLLSDGIYEVPSPSGELWGRERFQGVIDEGKQTSLSATIASCFSAARGWQQAQHFSDDAAVVGIELIGGLDEEFHG
ncbi:MAG TPA: SpoIIE family protein phosphatase [Nitrospiraceae bacterium]|nr:SpoIIE family protein phosphatase [Nitrospiraceae bacterium]